MLELLDSVQAYWVWLALACLLLAVEVLIVPTGLFLCLGSSAAVMAVVLFFASGISWLWSLTLFSGLLVLSGLFWWRIIKKRSKAREETDEGVLNVKTRQLIGYRAVLAEDIKAGRGRLRVNDSPWPIEAEADYPAGSLVEVVEVKGITLRVKLVQE